MYMIEITEHKMNGLMEQLETAAECMIKAKECFSELCEKSKMNHREYEGDDDDEMEYRMRERYGNRSNYRRGVAGSGRYSRY